MEYSRSLKSGAKLVAGLVVIWALPAAAQYPGHIDTKVKAGPVLRSIAVLEWTGEAGKPTATRLIPVSVFDDGQFQAGGLYLARPQPLALETGTEYQLVEAGLPQGLYDVDAAQQWGDDWFGYGDWKPLPPPEAVHALQPSKIDPEVIDPGSDRRPHFRKAAPETDAPGTGGSAPPVDPERPTLQKRSGNSGSGDTGPSSSAGATNNLESPTEGADPDRPRLTRKTDADEKKPPAHLEGMPANLEQMVAVSDATTRPEHVFAYKWASADDAGKLQAQLADLAIKAIAKKVAEESPKKSAAAKTATPKAVTHPATSPATAARRRTAAKKPVAAPALAEVHFAAFELTYSGGATLVFTARSAGDEAKAHYVTVIAQPDIYGVPQVLFTQVTNASNLDTTPRLRLIDAVDAAADNRGELLFELRGSTTREFALYRVASGRMDTMIATGPLPLLRPLAE